MATITVYTTAGGKRYRVNYRKPDNSQSTKRGFRRKSDAELWAANNIVTKANGTYIDESKARITIGDLGPKWLETKVLLKPSALAPLHFSWRLYVEPMWGRRAISSIGASEVEQWVRDLTLGKAANTHPKPGPRSASTVIRAHGVLAGILDLAVRDKRLLTNPARGVALPEKTSKRHAYLTHRQVELLAVESKANGPLVRFLAYTGLRWGEATALRVRDIDGVRLRATVHKNAVLVGGKIHEGSPKSGKARSVPVADFLILELEPLLAGKTAGDLVFGDGQKFILTPSTRDGWFKYAVARAQAKDQSFPKLTLHDLRHTAASLAISSGANVKAIQRMLGHESAVMTLDVYGDLFDDDLDAVGTALSDARNRAVVVK